MSLHLPFLLYGNLIIALLGVFIPLFLFLLKTHRKGIREYELMQEEMAITFGDLIKGESKDKLDARIEKYRKGKSEADKKKKNLNPKRQIGFLACSGGLSLLFLLIYLLVKANYFGDNVTEKCNPYAWIGLSISLICFLWAIGVIWQLMCLMIEVDQLIEQREDHSKIEGT